MGLPLQARDKAAVQTVGGSKCSKGNGYSFSDSSSVYRLPGKKINHRRSLLLFTT